MSPFTRALSSITLALAGCDDGPGLRLDSGIMDAGSADEGPDAAEPPPPTACLPNSIALSPRNGYATGGTLTPTFRWSESDGALRYEIQVDDSCGGDFSACSFDSPEVSESTADTSLTLTSALPVSDSAPVGRRYYWRVRPCDSDDCLGWTEVRYLDVGRTPKDFDGDGFADAVVGSRSKDNGAINEGGVFVYYGSAGGLPADPDQTLDSPDNQDGAGFGFAVAAADLNGDGFGDLIVGAPSQDSQVPNEGLAFVFHGSAAGLPAAPDVRLDNPDDEELAFFGSTVADAGDLDGDGYSDLAVGTPSRRGGVGGVFVYLGSAGGVAETPSWTLDHPAAVPGGNFGAALASAGDFGGDGRADLLVGAPGDDLDSPGGAVFVYCGSPQGLGAPNVTLGLPGSDPMPENAEFGSAVAGGDFDGDGRGDVVVGVSRRDNVFVFLAGPSGLIDAPDNALQGTGRFGGSLAAGDLNGDGRDDLVVGAEEADNGAIFEGGAYVFLGTTFGLGVAATRTLDNPANEMNGHFGASVSVIGDVDGDGDGEILIGAPLQSGAGQAFLYRWGAGGIPLLPDLTLSEPAGESGAKFGFSVALTPPIAPDANQIWFGGLAWWWTDTSI